MQLENRALFYTLLVAEGTIPHTNARYLAFTIEMLYPISALFSYDL